MWKGAGKVFQGPFPCETEQSHEEVEDLKDWDGIYCAVQIIRHEVPEHLRPDKALDRTADLVCIHETVRLAVSCC